MRNLYRRGIAALTAAAAVFACSTSLFAQAPAPAPVVPLEEPDAFASDQPPAPAPAPAPAPLEPSPLNPPVSQPSPSVPAQPAVTQNTAPQLSGGFTVRLARAPKMMGDFFGNNFAPGSGRVFVGEAVHHITSIDDFHLVDPVSGFSDVVAYRGGPGSGQGTFFVPGPAPPAPDVVEGLSSNVPGEFVAVGTDQFVDVLNFPGDTMFDIEFARVFNIFEVVAVTVPASGPGELIGRTRLQDNNSAMPQDRVYFDYSYFHNAALTAGGVEVNRFAPGFEKTFGDGIGSIELRVPFGVTINSSQVVGAPRDLSSFEFGNIVVAPKVLLNSGRDYAIAAGLGVSLPTSDDIVFTMSGGAEALRIKNEAIHLLPYIAMLYAPQCSDAFAHLFMTLDFDTGGNTVYADLGNPSLDSLGRWHDQHLLTVNASYGRWVYQSSCPNDRLQAIALSSELHFTQSISDADSVSGGLYTVGDPNADISLLNATFGAHAQIGLTTISTGYAVPVTSDERVFDGELRIIANRTF